MQLDGQVWFSSKDNGGGLSENVLLLVRER